MLAVVEVIPGDLTTRTIDRVWVAKSRFEFGNLVVVELVVAVLNAVAKLASYLVRLMGDCVNLVV